MDELMGSNEINMQIAAMTPAVILLVAIRRGFRLLFYAVFQVGKSKEEIYTQFRQTILGKLLFLQYQFALIFNSKHAIFSQSQTIYPSM